MTRLLLAAGVMAALATPAAATPLNWEFHGLVTSPIGPSDFPVGTPVTFNWSADPTTPNACAGINPAVGIYFEQHLTQHIAGRTYDIEGILTVGTNIARGCSGPADSVTELRLIQWSGPSLSNGTPIVPYFVCCASPAWIWNSTGGAYPLLPPRSFFFQGPVFLNGAGVSGVVADVVPEPATLSLLALGSGALAIRNRRRARVRSYSYQSLRASFRSSGTKRTPARSRSSAAARRVSS